MSLKFVLRYLPSYTFEHPSAATTLADLAAPEIAGMKDGARDYADVAALLGLLRTYFSGTEDVALDRDAFIRWMRREPRSLKYGERDVRTFAELLTVRVNPNVARVIEKALADHGLSEAIATIGREIAVKKSNRKCLARIESEVASLARQQDDTCASDLLTDEEEDAVGEGRPILTPLVGGDGQPVWGYAGDLWGMIAGAKIGKSTVLIELAASLVRLGINVLFLDFENGRKITKADFGSALAQTAYPLGQGVPALIRRNAVRLLHENPDWGRIKIVNVLPGSDFPVRRFRQEIDLFEQQTGRRLDVVVIDYLDKEKVHDPEIRKAFKDDTAYEARLISRVLGILRERDVLGVTGFQTSRKAHEETAAARRKGMSADPATYMISGSYSKIRLCAMNFVIVRPPEGGCVLQPRECRYRTMDGVAPAYDFVPSWERGFLRPKGNTVVPDARAVRARVEAKVREVADAVRGLPPSSSVGSAVRVLQEAYKDFVPGTAVAMKRDLDAALAEDGAEVVEVLRRRQMLVPFTDGKRVRHYTTSRKVSEDGEKANWYVFSPPHAWRDA